MTIFWVLLLVFYFLLQGLGTRQQRQPDTATTDSASAGGNAASTRSADVDDALREIREMMQTGDASQRETPRRQPQSSSPTRRGSERSETPLQHRRTPSASSPQRGSRTSASSPNVELDIPDVMQRPTSPGKPQVTAAAKHQSDPEAPSDRTELKTLRERLKDPALARDAVLYTEIFGPPRSRRPFSRSIRPRR